MVSAKVRAAPFHSIAIIVALSFVPIEDSLQPCRQMPARRRFVGLPKEGELLARPMLSRTFGKDQGVLAIGEAPLLQKAKGRLNVLGFPPIGIAPLRVQAIDESHDAAGQTGAGGDLRVRSWGFHST
jgi:hypothetical protein